MVELTQDEIELILTLLNQADVRGVESMRRVLALVDKLNEVKSDADRT